MRYLCCSDLHLGAGADLGVKPGERLGEQAAMWQQIIFLAAERGCQAILFAGDAFHRNKPTPQELLAFADPLAECPIPVYAINGNSHDFVGVDQAMAVTVVDALSDSFQLFVEPQVITIAGGTTLAMLPWAPVARIVASHDGGDRDEINQLAADLLLEVARGLRAQCPAGSPSVLMTHFSISGAALPSGLSIDMAREPILPLTDLEQLGFDCVIAGHIHRPQLMETSIGAASGPIFYCGSPAPLSFGEPGEHGVWIIETDDDGRFASEFVPLSSPEFVTVDLTDREVEEMAAGTMPALAPAMGRYVKVRYCATEEQARRIDSEALRAHADEYGARRIWIEPTVSRAHRERGAVLDSAGSRIDQLAAYLEASGVNGDVAPAMLERAGKYIG